MREQVDFDFRDDCPEAGAELAVTLRDGRVVRAEHDAGIPSADIAAQGTRLAAKFDALAEPVLGAARTRELRATIEGLDGLGGIAALSTLATHH